MKNKVLIIGPFSDYGGRELEVSFLSNLLSKNSYDIVVCSTGSYSTKSQIFNFNKNLKTKSLNKLVFEKSIFIRLISIIYFIRYFFNKKPINYISNKFTKKRLDLLVKVEIEKLIDYSGLIIICAQLSSSYMQHIVDYCKLKNKKVLFRTTGKISDKQICNNKNWLEKVDLFMNHSKTNSLKLNKINNNISIIDQCAYNEVELLEIPVLNKKVNNFLSISRLTKDKNIDILIQSFILIKEKSDKLYIVGDGPELLNLKKLAQGHENIIFTGYLPNNKIVNYLENIECVIVTYYKDETGPLTGIEAMSSAKIIISSATGAMPERIPFNHFWFKNSIDELKLQLNKVKKMNEFEINKISIQNRKRYINKYSYKEIESLFLKDIKEYANRL